MLFRKKNEIFELLAEKDQCCLSESRLPRDSLVHCEDSDQPGYMYEYITLYDYYIHAICLYSCNFIFASYIVTIYYLFTSWCQCTWTERNKELFEIKNQQLT